MIYEIKFHSKAEKFITKRPYKEMIRILRAIGKLPKGDICKMQGHDNAYRLRVSSYRVIFEISEITSELTLLDITDAGNRGQIYKGK